jgi:hypothetical protein
MRDTKCRSCHAPIFWVVMGTGRNMPLDDEATSNGNVRIGDDGTAGSVLAGDRLRDAQAVGEKLHLSHFVTCPDRKEWRR